MRGFANYTEGYRDNYQGGYNSNNGNGYRDINHNYQSEYSTNNGNGREMPAESRWDRYRNCHCCGQVM